jgi:hypothetical protein
MTEIITVKSFLHGEFVCDWCRAERNQCDDQGRAVAYSEVCAYCGQGCAWTSSDPRPNRRAKA